MRHSLGIDLGGTTAKIGLVDQRFNIVREASVSTAGFPNPTALANRLAKECRALARGFRIRRLGVGVAGDIDSRRGVVRVSPNLGWCNVPLKALLERRLKISVAVDNDAKAAAWGLYKTLIPHRFRNLVVITLGTGVGGGIILDGKLHRGETGSAGEIGHMNISESGPRCNCGSRGCLETYVGGPHLVRRVQRDLRRGRSSRLRRLYLKDPSLITPLAVAQAAKKGDRYARKVWEEVGQALGIAVGDLIYLLNPQLICFTGGIAQADQLFLPSLRKSLRTRSFKTPIRAVDIRVSPDAAHRGVVGASLL